MKRISLISSVLLASLLTLISCQREDKVQGNIVEEGNNVVISIKAKGGVDTKTYVDGSSIKWTATGEKLKVFEVFTPTSGDATTKNNTSSDGVTTDGGATMNFGVSFTENTNTGLFEYYAIYPSTAYHDGSDVSSIPINTKGSQTPTATSFDPTADLLIAEKVNNGTSQASSLSMSFTRPVSIGKMTIKNLGSTDPVTRISFSAKIGDNAVNLAGRTTFNLEAGTPVSAYGDRTQEHSIILDYSALSLTANTNTGLTAYFTCFPFAINAENPGSFKVVVETATKSFTKEVSVNSAKGLAFKVGKASTFSVDMDGIVGVDKAFNGCYAYLDYNDFTAAGGTNSYSNVTVNKTHGDTWSMYATGTTEKCIGVRRHDGENPNDSYIKLPDFKDNIKQVVVTLASVTSGKTITLETSATGTGGSIASLSTTTESEYIFDLSSSSYKTAYFRSNDFQAKVAKIEVYAGNDTRTAFTAPNSVTATLNASSNNSIDVSWDPVENASGYIITLIPDSGDDVVVKSASSPYTVSGLQYEMDYLVSVQAEPADYYVNIVSVATSAENVVETGEEPSGSSWILVSSISDITAGGKYLLATNDKANVYNGSVSSGHLQVVSVSPINNKISDSDLPASAAQIVFESAGSDNSYYLKVGDKYISANKASSGGFENDGTTPFQWNFSNASSGLIAKGETIAAYIRSYSNNSFRSYGNTSNGATFYLYKLDDGKADAGISFSPVSATITFGEALSQPTLNNSHNLSVTYASNATGVATVTSNGVIAVVGAGSATITASWTEQKIEEVTYRAGEAKFVLTVNKATPTIAAFVNPTTSVAVGGTVMTNTTTISNSLAITYTSSNTSVATVDETTGVVTGVADGTATISATFDGNANYNAAEAQTYIITVGTGGSTTPDPETFDFSKKGYTNQQEISSVSGDNMTISFDKGTNSNVPKYYTSGTAVRVYGGGYFTVSSSYNISKIEITFGDSDGSNAITTDVSTYTNGTWTGSAKAVKFTIGGTSGNRRIKVIKVTYE